MACKLSVVRLIRLDDLRNPKRPRMLGQLVGIFGHAGVIADLFQNPARLRMEIPSARRFCRMRCTWPTFNCAGIKFRDHSRMGLL